MRLTRRDWLAAHAGIFLLRQSPSELETRIARIVQEYSDQGIHRTATVVDDRSADWLVAQASAAGVRAGREAFPIDRVDIVAAYLEIGDRRIEGIPLFDAAFTDAAGIRGQLSGPDGKGDVLLLDLAPNSAGAGAVGEKRRQNAARAIIAVTRGGRPGLCPSNADAFTAPFGPAVLQVSSDEGAWLLERARSRAGVRVVVQVARRRADAFNVVGTIAGKDRHLAPVVIMTPRSGWYSCASERGGGIACWLELMRTLTARSAPARDVIFVASSGHELGHLGINAFVDQRPEIVKNSVGWMHFGANIGASADPGNNVQSSDDESENRLITAMTAVALSIDRRVPRGTVPGGEAEVVHRGGGKYVSVIGRNGLFHNPLDRGATTVDAHVVARFVNAFSAVATALAG